MNISFSNTNYKVLSSVSWGNSYPAVSRPATVNGIQADSNFGSTEKVLAYFRAIGY